MSCNKNGSIEVICGPMFAGKTEELLRRAKRLVFAKRKFVLFKPSIDNRYSDDEVVSHSQIKMKGINIDVNNSKEICQYIDSDIEVIIVDEVQFFNESLLDILNSYVKKGLRIICAGLDTDFTGKPFGLMPSLLAIADDITKLTAICNVCGHDATRTQRIIDGHPAKVSDPIVLIGATESYEPRCHNCHEVINE